MRLEVDLLVGLDAVDQLLLIVDAGGAKLHARHGAGAVGDLRQHALVGPDFRFDGAAAGLEDADDLELAALRP